MITDLDTDYTFVLRNHSWELCNNSNNSMSLSADETDDLLSAVLC